MATAERARFAAVLLMPIAGVSCDGGTCAIDAVIAERLGSDDSAAEDCGRLTLDDDDAAFETSHDCVASHLAGGGAFKVRWRRMSIDSRVEYGLLGQADGSVYAVHYDGGDGDGAVANTYRCSGITDDCTANDLRSTLCITCGVMTLVRRCDE